MSEENKTDCPAIPASGWTTDTLLALMNERDKRYEQNRASVDRALDLAQRENEKWRANANEWRQAMDDRERKFLTREIGLIFMLVSIAALALSIWRAIHS
jgi:L-lactate utilization protein LutC